jgi:hypothetical protein
MKKIAPYIIVFLAAVLFMNVFGAANDWNVDIDGDHFDGPLGALVGLLAGGLGIVIAGVVMVGVAALLAVIFAGLGIFAVGAVIIALLVGALALTPLLLPLLIPIGIIWFLVSRSRRNRERTRSEEIKAEPV